jgi:hypothetical protein
MAFFKADHTFSEIKELEAKSAPKLRYVIENGKGRWIRPEDHDRLPYDYDEDIPC